MKKLSAKRAAQLESIGATVTRKPVVPPVPEVIAPVLPPTLVLDTAGIERILSQFTLDQAGLIGALRAIRVPQPAVTVQAAKRVVYREIEVTDVTYQQGRVRGIKARLSSEVVE